MADLTHPGGIANFNTNQVVEHGDLNAIGTMALQSMVSMLRGYTRGPHGASAQGMVVEGLAVYASGGPLEADVDDGTALVLNNAPDDRGPLYDLVVVESESVEFTDQHATLPRIALVYLETDAELDVASSRRIYDVGSSTQVPTSVYLRRKVSGQIGIEYGVAATSPTAPALPPGCMLLAYVVVPPLSGGSITVHPRANRLQLTSDAMPAEVWQPHVVSGCAVTEVAGRALVADGVAVTVGGRVEVVDTAFLGHEATAAVNGRMDLFYLTSQGVVGVAEGPDDGSGDDPSLLATQLPIARGVVLPATSDYDSIDDLRVFKPVPVSNVDARTRALRIVSVTPQAGAGPKTVRVQVEDGGGNAVPEVTRVIVRLLDQSTMLPSQVAELILNMPTTGTNIVPDVGAGNQRHRLVETDAAGVLEIGVQSTSGTIPVVITFDAMVDGALTGSSSAYFSIIA